MNAVEIRDLTYHYDNTQVGLNNINLNITKGKKTAIIGINGSGKSTLLYHLNGSLLAQSGSIKILDQTISKKTIENIRKRVGFIFDYPDHQLFSTTVSNDIKFGPVNYNYSKDLINTKLNDILNRYSIYDLKDSAPYQLSLGQKKKVAIAGVSILEPDILVCDEPFSGLDPYALDDFIINLEEYIKKGKTIIFSTHDLDLTYRWADDVIVMKDNKIIAHDNVNTILEDVELLKEVCLKPPTLVSLSIELKKYDVYLDDKLDIIKKHL